MSLRPTPDGCSLPGVDAGLHHQHLMQELAGHDSERFVRELVQAMGLWDSRDGVGDGGAADRARQCFDPGRLGGVAFVAKPSEGTWKNQGEPRCVGSTLAAAAASRTPDRMMAMLPCPTNSATNRPPGRSAAPVGGADAGAARRGDGQHPVALTLLHGDAGQDVGDARTVAGHHDAESAGGPCIGAGHVCRRRLVPRRDQGDTGIRQARVQPVVGAVDDPEDAFDPLGSQHPRDGRATRELANVLSLDVRGLLRELRLPAPGPDRGYPVVGQPYGMPRGDCQESSGRLGGRRAAHAAPGSQPMSGGPRSARGHGRMVAEVGITMPRSCRRRPVQPCRTPGARSGSAGSPCGTRGRPWPDRRGSSPR